MNALTDDRLDLADIKRRLDERAEELLVELLGQPTSRRRNELRWGRRGSKALKLNGRNGPRWYDYEAQVGGTMLDAIMAALGCDFRGALDHARSFLGLAGEHTTRASIKPSMSRQVVDIDADDERKARQVAALVWASRPIVGTLAEKYLAVHRRIEAQAWPVEALAFVEAHDVQRCINELRWWRWPALLVKATDAAGNVTGLQLVALEADGQAARHWDHPGKLKLSYGRLRGAVVRLPGNEGEVLLLAEGLETAASCWWATGIETWANLGSIAKAPLDAVPVSRPVLICADDDARNATSNKALRDAIKAWRREGRTVLTVKPWKLTQGNKSDFNDLLQEGREAVRARIMAALEPASPTPLPPADEARRKVTATIDQVVDELLAWGRQRAEAPQDESPALFKVCRIDMGLGKTEAAIRRAVMAAKAGAKVAYLVPTHKLASELVERIKQTADKEGAEVAVEVWRGRKADRPDMPGETMCAELDIVEEAQRAKVEVAEVICKACPHAPSCPYLAQAEVKAQIWIGAHELLFHEPPVPMKDAELLIVDEGFALRGIKGIDGKPLLLTSHELEAVPAARDTSTEADLAAELMPRRRMLVEALSQHRAGGLERQQILDAGLTADEAASAAKLEWQAKRDVRPNAMTTWPGLRQMVAEAARHNRLIPRMAMLWRIVEEVLRDEGAATSGRATWDEHEINGSTIKAVRLYGIEAIAKGWQRMPALAIDATVDMAVLRCRVPHAELVERVEASTPSMRVTQFPDRAFGKLALRGERLLFRAWDWAVAHSTRRGGEWVVILPAEAEEKILARSTIPPFMTTAHFGGLRGLDRHRDVAGIIILGRPMAPPGEVERLAGILTGRQVERRVEGDRAWYPAEGVQLRARDGATVTVEADRHPDDLAEAVRASICEAELLQAIGRCRGVNRTSDNPVEVLVVTNVPVPGLVPDELRQWDGPTIDDEALSRHGVVAESPGDAAGILGCNVEAVRKARQRSGTISYKNLSYGNVPILRVGAYQRRGAGRSQQRVVWDARRIPDIKAWLVERLGELVHFEELPVEAPIEVTVIARDPVPLEVPAEVLIYRGGILPERLRAWSRFCRRAAGISQEEVARRIGLSRPQLANAEAGRFGLSPDAAARFMATVGSLEARQAAMSL